MPTDVAGANEALHYDAAELLDAMQYAAPEDWVPMLEQWGREQQARGVELADRELSSMRVERDSVRLYDLQPEVANELRALAERIRKGQL